MAFLRLSSEMGYQNFTYSCVNSIAWFNTQSEQLDLAVKLMGANEHVFNSNG